MGYQAVTVINGEVYDGLHQSMETQESTVVQGMVRPQFKGEINLDTGVSKNLRGTQVNMDNLRMSDQGVLSTAVNSGMPVRGIEDVKDTTLVTVQGIQMTAKSAAQLGLLSLHNGRYSEKKYDGNVSYEDPSQVPFEDYEGEEPSRAGKGIEMSHELCDSQVEGALEALASDLGSYEALERHALSVMGGLADGDITTSAARLASEAGGEPHQATHFITNVAERYIDKAADYISRNHGIDGNEVIQWIVDNVPSTERTSMAYEVYLGQTGALDRMAEKYRTSGRMSIR